MTVEELIKKLKELPQDAEVWCASTGISFCPDTVLLEENGGLVTLFGTV